MQVSTSSVCLKHLKCNTIKERQLLMLFMLLLALATSVAKSNNSTADNAATTRNKIISNRAPTTTPTRISKLSQSYLWGKNTKYSTIIFDENITVRGSTIVDVTYPNTDVLYSEYTIICLHTSAVDKLDSAVAERLMDDIRVFIAEGGVGSKFTTVRYVSRTSADVVYNLKIFGVNV